MISFECFNYLYCDPLSFTCQKRSLPGDQCDINLGTNQCGPGGSFLESTCAKQTDGTGKCVETLRKGDVCGDASKGVCAETQFDGTSICREGVCSPIEEGAVLTPCRNAESCAEGLVCAEANDSVKRCLRPLAAGSPCSQPDVIRDTKCADGLRCNGGGICTFDRAPVPLGSVCGSFDPFLQTTDCAPSASSDDEVVCSPIGDGPNRTCQVVNLDIGSPCDEIRNCRGRRSWAGERPISCVNGVCQMDDKQTVGMDCGEEGLPSCAEGLTCEKFPQFDIEVCTNFTKQVG